MDALYRFSLDRGVWEEGPKMRVARRSPGVVTYKGAVYAVGGMGAKKDLTSMEKLSPVTNKWSLYPGGLKALSGWLSAATIHKPVKMMESYS